MVRNIVTVPVERVDGGERSRVQDLLAVEEPLEIRLNGRTVAITMRTPSHDFELAAGFLFTEGILAGRHQIDSIRYQEKAMEVTLAPGVAVDSDRLQRNFYTTSSCGVCGKTAMDALRVIDAPAVPKDGPLFSAEQIHRLPEILRDAQAVFERTGGLHAAALFDSHGTLHVLREDVGRHNAVDKVIGSEMLAGRTPCSDRLIFVSSRASFELLQKTVMAGIPILAAVGAPSSLAVEAAQRFGITLLGFVRDGRFNVYSGAQRIL